MVYINSFSNAAHAIEFGGYIKTQYLCRSGNQVEGPGCASLFSDATLAVEIGVGIAIKLPYLSLFPILYLKFGCMICAIQLRP